MADDQVQVVTVGLRIAGSPVAGAQVIEAIQKMAADSSDQVDLPQFEVAHYIAAPQVEGGGPIQMFGSN